jgi:hypothetical protein
MSERDVSNTRSTAALTRTVAALLLTTVIGSCGTATGQTDAETGGQVEVIEFAVVTDQWAVLDLGTPGVSVGDMDVYSGGGVKDGRSVRGGGSCQVIHVEGDQVDTQCVLTMEFEDGSVTLQSVWRKGASPLDMAITGGTGAYSNARGVVRFWDIATPNERMRAEITR